MFSNKIIFISLLSMMLLTLLLTCSNKNKKVEKSTKIEVEQDTISQKIALSLKKELNQMLENFDCPGAAIYIIKDGKDLLEFTSGVKSTQIKTDSMNKNTMFRIGSLSKGFAGILAAKLILLGKIDPNAAVSKYIPDFKLKAKQKGDSIRVWNILSHSTGLTEHAFSNLVDQEKDKATLLKALNNVMVRDSTGKRYAYQNACFSMIEEIIEVSTGLKYNEALKKYILAPLKMNNTNLSYDSLMNCSNKCLPHRFNGKSNGFVPISLHKAYYNTPSAGGINSNLTDMKKWLKALLGFNESVISKKERDLAFEKKIFTSWDDKYYNSWEKADSSYYGFGWRSIRLNEKNIVFHGGQVNSYRCEIAINEKTKSGVVALFNSPCDLSNSIVPLVFSVID